MLLLLFSLTECRRGSGGGKEENEEATLAKLAFVELGTSEPAAREGELPEPVPPALPPPPTPLPTQRSPLLLRIVARLLLVFSALDVESLYLFAFI